MEKKAANVVSLNRARGSKNAQYNTEKQYGMLRSFRANTCGESASWCDASSETDSEPEKSGKG